MEHIQLLAGDYYSICDHELKRWDELAALKQFIQIPLEIAGLLWLFANFAPVMFGLLADALPFFFMALYVRRKMKARAQ